MMAASDRGLHLCSIECRIADSREATTPEARRQLMEIWNEVRRVLIFRLN